MRNSFACNIFIPYYVLLLVMETVGGIVCVTHESCDGQVKRVIWMLIGVTYVIILLCLICCYNTCVAYESHAHIGPISGVVAFEFLHAVIFWFSFILFIGGAAGGHQLVSYVQGQSVLLFISCTMQSM